MKKAVIAKIFMLMVLLLSVISCRPKDRAASEREESFEATPIKVYAVGQQRIAEKLFYTGVIKAWKEINITPDIGGKIARIYVREGDRVQQGQLLAELDTRAARLQLEQAQAGLAVAGASYQDAKRNMERMERLSKENAVSEQQYEKIRLAYEAAEAQLNQARALLNLAQHNLDVSLMKAPFSGVVASRNAEVGDVINPLMGGFSTYSGVLTLVDFSRVKIEIDVSQQDVLRIKKGQRALVGVGAWPGKEFEGEVSLVNLVADPLTKKFKVEVLLDNPGLMLRPNTFGEVIFEVAAKEEALVVPQKAIVEGRYVFVVRDDTAYKKEVTLGLQNSTIVEVISGLNQGDIIVVEGNYGLEDKAKIKVKEVIQ